MVYKRYIKRNGKVCGPYYYESYRDKNGKVVSKYLPDYKPSRKVAKTLLFVFLIFVFIVLGLLSFRLTGNAIFQADSVGEKYNVGDKLNGSISFTMGDGEFVSNSSNVSMSLMKNGIFLDLKTISINDFLEGLLYPVEITNETSICETPSVSNQLQICENITVNNSIQICDNITISSIVENCTEQCLDYQDCIDILDSNTNETSLSCETKQNCTNVCINETVLDIVENCSAVNNETFLENCTSINNYFESNCTNRTVINYYFNQTGNYSHEISELINYSFNESGDYILRIESKDLGILIEKNIRVDNGEKIFGIESTPGPVFLCQVLDTPGIYTQTANITPSGSIRSCINITSSNIVYDCNGSLISNQSLEIPGIYAENVNNITIKNCNIDMGGGSSGSGIKFKEVNDSSIINNTVYSNYFGIYLESSLNNNVSKNNAGGNSRGIYLTSSSNNSLIENDASDNTVGLWLISSSNNILSEINTNSCTTWGITFESSSNNILSEINTNQNSIGFSLEYSSNNNVSNSNISSNGIGLSLSSSYNNLLSNLNVSYNSDNGIHIFSSSNNQLYNIFSSFNGDGSAGNGGFYLQESDYTQIFNSSFFNNFYVGTTLFSSSHNNFTNCNFSNQDNAVSGNGIIIFYGSNNIIKDSYASHNGITGMRIRQGSFYNSIINSTSEFNNDGIGVEDLDSRFNNVTNCYSKSNNRCGYALLNASSSNYFSNDIGFNSTLADYCLSFGAENNTIFNSSSLNSRGIGFRLNSVASNILSNIFINSSQTNGIEILNGRLNSGDGLIYYSYNNSLINFYVMNTAVNYKDLNISQRSNSQMLFQNVTAGKYSFYESGFTPRIKDINYGEIVFNSIINASGNNFSNDFKISYNLAYVNSSISGLNKSANITFLLQNSVSIPKIFRNGISVCSYNSFPTCSNLTSLKTPTVSFNVSSWSNYSIMDLAQVSSCRILDVSGVYNQTANIVPTENLASCINITASNVQLDCNGYWISNTSLAIPGIYAGTNLVNITVKNCNVTMNVGYGGNGIQFNKVNNSYILNNHADSNNLGIYLVLSFNNNLTGNNLANNFVGIFLLNSSNSLLNFNFIRSPNSLGPDWHGVNLDNSNYNNITNNLVNNISGGLGVSISSSSYNLLINNTANLDNGGILVGGSNNQIINNTINSNSNGLNNFAMSISGSNNSIVNINLWNNTLNNCIQISGSNNSLVGGIINLTSGNAIALYGGANNIIIKDFEIINSTNNDTSLTSNSINNTFLNVSYNSSKEYVESGSQLIRKWYFNVNVTDSLNSISDANVYSWNRTNDFQFSDLTRVDGSINSQELVEYVNNGQSINYPSDYILSVIKNGYLINSTFINLSGNLKVAITLNDIISPTVNLNSPLNNANYVGTSYSVTFGFSASDLGIGIANCSVYVNNGGYENTSSISSNNNIIVNLVPGIYDSYVNCTDYSGNIGNSSKISFVISAPSNGNTNEGGGGGGSGGGNTIVNRSSNTNNTDFNNPGSLVNNTETNENLEKENNNHNFSNTDNLNEIPRSECSNWSLCSLAYDLNDILENNLFFGGNQTRKCFLNGKVTLETKPCNLKTNINILKIPSILGKSIEIENEENISLATLEFIPGEVSRLDIKFVLVDIQYPSHCYDNLKNYNELGINCGEECEICLEKPGLEFNILFFIIPMVIIISIIIVFISVLYVKSYNLRLKLKELKDSYKKE
ncbi:Right handed beta helix region [uncultured archaeon]|nr:Right handed beta helix region [uncultured archaeon]